MDKCVIPFEVPDVILDDFRTWYGGNTKKFVCSLIDDYSDPQYRIWRNSKMSLHECDAMIRSNGGLQLYKKDDILNKHVSSDSDADLIPSSQPLTNQTEEKSRFTRLPLSLNQSAKKIYNSNNRSSDSGISSKPTKTADQPRKQIDSDVSDSEDSDREYKRKQKMAAQLKLLQRSILRAKTGGSGNSSEEDSNFLSSSLNKTLGLNSLSSHHLYANSIIKNENKSEESTEKVHSSRTESKVIKPELASPVKTTLCHTAVTESDSSDSDSSEIPETQSSLNVQSDLPKKSLPVNVSHKDSSSIHSFPSVSKQPNFDSDSSKDSVDVQALLSMPQEKLSEKSSSTSDSDVEEPTEPQSSLITKGNIHQKPVQRSSSYSEDSDFRESKSRKTVKSRNEAKNKSPRTTVSQQTKQPGIFSRHCSEKRIIKKEVAETEVKQANNGSSSSDSEQDTKLKCQPILKKPTSPPKKEEHVKTLHRKVVPSMNPKKNVQNSSSSSEVSDDSSKSDLQVDKKPNIIEPVKKQEVVDSNESSDDSDTGDSSDDEEAKGYVKLEDNKANVKGTVNRQEVNESEDSSDDEEAKGYVKLEDNKGTVNRQEVNESEDSSDDEEAKGYIKLEDNKANVKEAVNRQEVSESEDTSEDESNHNSIPEDSEENIKRGINNQEASDSDSDSETDIKDQPCLKKPIQAGKTIPQKPGKSQVPNISPAKSTSSDSSDEENLPSNKGSTKSYERSSPEKKYSPPNKEKQPYPGISNVPNSENKDILKALRKDSLNLSQFQPEFSSSFSTNDCSVIKEEDWLEDLKELNYKLWENLTAPRAKIDEASIAWDDPRTKVLGFVQLPKGMDPKSLERCRLKKGKHIGKYEVASINSRISSTFVAFPGSQEVRAVSIPQSVVISEQLLEVSLPEIDVAKDSGSDEDAIAKTPLPIDLKRRNPLGPSPASGLISSFFPPARRSLPSTPTTSNAVKKQQRQLQLKEMLNPSASRKLLSPSNSVKLGKHSPTKEVKEELNEKLDVDDVINQMLFEEEKDKFDGSVVKKKKKKKNPAEANPLDDIMLQMMLEEELKLKSKKNKKNRQQAAELISEPAPLLKTECKVEEDPFPFIPSDVGEEIKQKKKKKDRQQAAELISEPAPLLKTECTVEEEPFPVIPSDFGEQIKQKKKKKNKDEAGGAIIQPSEIREVTPEVSFPPSQIERLKEDQLPVYKTNKHKTKKNKELITEPPIPADFIKFECKVEEDAVPSIANDFLEPKKKKNKHKEHLPFASGITSDTDISKKKQLVHNNPSDYTSTMKTSSTEVTEIKKEKKKLLNRVEHEGSSSRELASRELHTVETPRKKKYSKQSDAELISDSELMKKTTKKLKTPESLKSLDIDALIEARAAELAAQKLQSMLKEKRSALRVPVKTEIISDIKVEDHDPYIEPVKKKKKKDGPLYTEDPVGTHDPLHIAHATLTHDPPPDIKMKKKKMVHSMSDMEEQQAGGAEFLVPSPVSKKKKRKDKDLPVASQVPEEVKIKKLKQPGSQGSVRGIVIDSNTVSLCSEDELLSRKHKIAATTHEMLRKKAKR